MFTLAWLPSWDWCPPLLNLCERRRFGLDVDGCLGVDIVSWGFVIVCSVSVGIVWCSWDVLRLLLVCFICICFPGGSGVVLLLRVGVMADFLPEATVGSIPTVFIGWVVGLVYR
jgi:hypothetical protein